MKRMPAGGVLALGAVLASLAVSPATAAAKGCGHIPAPSSDGAYDYRVTAQGPITCKTARTVIRRFLHRGTVTKGWDCRNGARPLRWTAACGSPYRSLQRPWRDRDYRRIVKAFVRYDP